MPPPSHLLHLHRLEQKCALWGDPRNDNSIRWAGVTGDLIGKVLQVVLFRTLAEPQPSLSTGCHTAPLIQLTTTQLSVSAALVMLVSKTPQAVRNGQWGPELGNTPSPSSSSIILFVIHYIHHHNPLSKNIVITITTKLDP